VPQRGLLYLSLFHTHTLPHTHTHMHTHTHTHNYCLASAFLFLGVVINTPQVLGHCNALQHATTYTATYTETEMTCKLSVCCSVLQCVAVSLQHTATHCNTLQHTATHCNTLQHTRGVTGHNDDNIGCKNRAHARSLGAYRRC